MKYFSAIALLPVLAVGCGGDSPQPAPANGGGEAATPAAETAMPGGISEADFKALHTLTEEERPPAAGEYIHLAGGKAYLSLPKDAQAPLPAVLLIHEWWGLNDHVKHWADRLAADGYAALAVDLYDGKIATTPDDAMAFMKAVDPQRARGILKTGHAFLGSDPRVQASKRAVMGWCFGGHWSLQQAIQTPDLTACVIYYGRLITDPEQLKQITSPVCGVFGNQDTGIPPAAVDEWLEAMKVTGVSIDVHRFDAPHAFANPSNSRYDAKSAEAAWAKVRAFLAGHLKH